LAELSHMHCVSALQGPALEYAMPHVVAQVRLPLAPVMSMQRLSPLHAVTDSDEQAARHWPL